jgi:FHIPEP family
LASQLRFEGPSLEALLDRVREELGADANIVAANRVRKGRVFARDGFEVIVDLPDPSAPAREVPEPVPEPAFEQMPRMQRMHDEHERVQATVLDLAGPVPARHLDMPTTADEPFYFDAEPEYDPTPTRVIALGVPPEHARAIAGSDNARRAIVQRIARISPSKRRSANEMFVAVVGSGPAPLELARRIADEYKIDPEHIMLATHEPDDPEPEIVPEVTHDTARDRGRERRRSRPRYEIDETPAPAPRIQTASGFTLPPGRTRSGKIPVIALDPMIEHVLVDALCTDERGTYLDITPKAADQFVRGVIHVVQTTEMRGIDPILVCSTQLRGSLERLLRTVAPRLPVLAYTEFGSQLELETIGVVNLGQPTAV